MRDLNSLNEESKPALALTLRDFLAIGFRQRGLMVASFLLAFSAALLYATLKDRTYEAHLKILVKHERVELPVSSEDKPAVENRNSGVTEQDLNSEIELLKSRDLLEKVVLTLGLHEPSNES